MTNADVAVIERPATNSRIFAHTRWDILPTLGGLFHLAWFLAMYFMFPYTPLWIMLGMGFIYALMINANVNGVSHNFIHNPFFRSTILNRLFAVVESVACCFSQSYYDVVHMQHHKGNADLPDENGETIDWISIYKHGHDGEAENPWAYVFLSFFRDNPASVIKNELAKRGKVELRWGNVELAVFISVLLAMAIIVPTRPIHFINWRYMAFFLPFFYLGHCFSYLNGYFRHYGANPDKPIAWGVSSYGKIYNWLFFYNGYHAEHHFRPKVHWTRMEQFRQSIGDLQKREGVRVIEHAHMLGFLDPNLPKRGKRGSAAQDRSASDPAMSAPEARA